MTTDFSTQKAPLEIKFLADSGRFEGYASVFHITDNVNDVILPGAFKATLQKYKSQGRLPPLLWQHDTAQPIGAWRDMFEDNRGLYVSGELFINDIPKAREAYKLLKENVVTGLSIGYKTKQSHRDAQNGSRVLTDVDLLEISMVTFPANDFARASTVKSCFERGDVPSEREFEAFLRDAGMSRKQAKGFISGGYKTLCLRDAGHAQTNTMDEDMSLVKYLTETLRHLS